MTGLGRALAIGLSVALPAFCRSNPDAIRFFEMKIRPLFHNNCIACHSDQKLTSGPTLESRREVTTGRARQAG